MTLEEAREALFSLEEANRRKELRIQRLDALNGALRRLLSTPGDRVLDEVFDSARCFLSFDVLAVVREDGEILTCLGQEVSIPAPRSRTPTVLRVLDGRSIATDLSRVLGRDELEDEQRPALCVPLALEKTRGFVVFVRSAGSKPFDQHEVEHGQSLALLVSEALALRERDEARAESRSKSAFLATISHELRTPLNGIIGMTELLQQEQMPEGHREKLATIDACGQALLELIDSVLDYAKQDASVAEVAIDAVSPLEIAESAAALVAHRIIQSGVAFSIDIAADTPPKLVTDRRRLRQVLVNLLGNAQKFTEAGSIRVSISGLERNGRGYVRFAVSDTGIGIPEEARARLFQPFSQVDESISRRYGGTGLGLAICRQLVAALGGVIDFRSRVGDGTTFNVDIPCMPDAPLPSVEPGTAASGASMRAGLHPGDGAPAAPLRILLAEDNKVNQTVARLMLERMGHDVRVVANGAEALQALDTAVADRSLFDIVLMDMQMPVMDGLTAMKAIRERGAPIAQVPVVAITASAFESDRRLCLAAEMKGFVSKPLMPANLSQAIADALSATGAPNA
jgi:signal transduction histidine kinase